MSITTHFHADSGVIWKRARPRGFSGLPEATGSPDFEVRTVDEQGNADPSPARWIWALDRNNG